MSSAYSWVTYRETCCNAEIRNWIRGSWILMVVVAVVRPPAYFLSCVSTSISWKKKIPTKYQRKRISFPTKWRIVSLGMRASWDVINLACDEKAASQQAKPIEDAIITHTHVYMDFVPRTCQAAEALSVSCFQTFSYKWHAIRYDR